MKRYLNIDYSYQPKSYWDKDYSSETKAAKQETANLLRKHGGKTSEELKAEGK